ncbi:hypothetical protein QTH97_35515 [Variovorax sp. J22R24]|uniref:hypothetical protein n=1 Tax=Variovorax gracilis TaxID=3053502 RepID=UPI002574BFBF|nr:hypothetical protein [Variovorax sp. J22R24]MDM0110244.1 hypothetical protein [Variovorax sp. J22R24]
MAGSEYGSRQPEWRQDEDRGYRELERDRSDLSRDESTLRQGDNYERGYWANDFNRGDARPANYGRAIHRRDSWRTHGEGFSGSGGSGAYGVRSEQGRGLPGPGFLSDDDDQQDWNMPTGPRTWGSGVGRGVQGRGMRESRHSDPDYQQWRNEQLERFDDDFEAFRRERYGKFAEEFNTWRSSRANNKSSPEGAGAKPSSGSGSGGTSGGSSSPADASRAAGGSSSKQQG